MWHRITIATSSRFNLGATNTVVLKQLFIPCMEKSYFIHIYNTVNCKIYCIMDFYRNRKVNEDGSDKIRFIIIVITMQRENGNLRWMNDEKAIEIVDGIE